MELPRVSLIVPIYNNADTLIRQLAGCEKILKINTRDWEIIICDDGSVDETKNILSSQYARRPNYRVFYHEKNLGIAKTIRQLYEQAKYDYILLFSVDGDWDPEDIAKLMTRQRNSGADIVIGKRSKTNYTLYRKLVSFFYNALPHLLFAVKTHDAGSIKIIKRSLYNSIHLQSKSVFFEAELIIKATKAGAHIETVPVRYHKHTPGIAGRLDFVLDATRDMINLVYESKSWKRD